MSRSKPIFHSRSRAADVLQALGHADRVDQHKRLFPASGVTWRNCVG
jgi:hypothetical protein